MHKNLIKIAIVDDSKTMLLTLKAMLNGLGYQNTETFSSARLAFDEIKKDSSAYHCVLTDLNMPELDGMAFIRQLGEIGFNGGVAIVQKWMNVLSRWPLTLLKFIKSGLLAICQSLLALNKLKWC